MEKNKLFIIATPIGNKEDISLRAIRVLKETQVIFCENTINSQKLLKHYGINSKLISLNKYNEKEKLNSIKKFLELHNVALISDAGTPCISDPGQYVISSLKKENFNITPIPGSNSIITFLSASGIFFNSFSFFGFSPKKEREIIEIIYNNLNSDLIVFFESPLRIKKTLNFLKNEFGDIEVTIGRELTKIYEEIITEKISSLLEKNFLGEIIFAFETKQLKNKKNPLNKKEMQVLSLLKNEKISKESIYKISKLLLNKNKNEVYDFIFKK